MNNLILIRLIRTVLTLLGVVTLTFFLGRLTGDPVAMMLPQSATMEDYERMRAALGLDEPLPLQFVVYIGDVLRGNLGTSIVYSRSAVDIVAERIPATLELGLPALILSITLGIPLGILAAVGRDGWFDRLIMALSLAGQSLPSFFVGILLILFFGVQLGWTPVFGRDTPSHYILPTITLTIYPLAFIIRMTRSSILDILSENYIRTAHAKGLPSRYVIAIHALRNALIPVVTVIGLQVAAILSGSAIVETVFAWPGIGQLAVQSIGGRDFPIIQAIVLITAAAFGVTNLVIDFVYVIIDPRIQVS